jgi:hypothetical protein
MKLWQETIPLVLLSLSMISGCGGPQDRAEVSGTVRLNGQPLPTGAISFVPTEGTTGPSSGALIADGAYHIVRAQGAAVGKNRVSIRCVVKTGGKTTNRMGTSEDAKQQVVPPKYNDQSELVCDIKSGSNPLDFDLKVDVKEWPAATYLKTLKGN